MKKAETEVNYCQSGNISREITRLMVDKDKPKGWFKGNWRDKYSGLLWATLSVWDSETWDTLLILRGTKVIYLDYVGTLRPSKSYLWGGRVVAHKILETAQSPDLGLRTWTQACH